MDRLHALRDTANLPRAVAPPLCPAHLSLDDSGRAEEMDDSGLDMKMDDSLTDMQWLQRMDAASDFPGIAHKGVRKRPKSDKENQRPKSVKEGCRKKLDYGLKLQSNKPPLSYASLIVLAISSTPQRMLTLSGIYRWIESTFPFYRTPESKAWKNSIRHNLSIRKNMFTKVCQFPPRRGNGSYWTILLDGEDELKKAYPLFTTLLPPVIDEDSAYCRVPLTHTVKSKGQFVPVLPQSNRKTPYFALQGTTVGMSDSPITAAIPESLRFEEIVPGKKTLKMQSRSSKPSSSTPKHLMEHSYAKTLTFEPRVQEVEEELAPEDLVESSFVSDTISLEPELKRFCTDSDVRGESESQRAQRASNPQIDICDSTTDGGAYDVPELCMTPVHCDGDEDPADCTLNLLDASFLTPMKTAMPDIALDAISFSPLYNFVSPQRGGTPPPPRRNSPHCAVTPTTNPPSSDSIRAISSSSVPVPAALSPLGLPLMSTGRSVSDFDSGIFSPLISSLQFSTPLMKGVSPLVDLPRNVFNTPLSTDIFTPLRALDRPAGATPTRKIGSRQRFVFPDVSPSSEFTQK